MRYGSVCSGIESASVAWGQLGWSPSWFAEIEPFPSAVLAYHWPHVNNLGDMCRLPWLLDQGLVEAPEVLVGGTPCQSFSVAGMRAGLEDERGQLTIKYVEVANAIDRQRQPNDECIIVWENVPGVLSDKSNAFGCFLAALVGEEIPLEPPGKKWSNVGVVRGPQRAAAWRILDAQYFGVAQRRRRVFVVASARNRFDPCEVLFESEGLRRDTPPGREAGQETTGNAGDGSYSTSGAGYWREGVGALRSREQDSHENLIAMATGQGGAEIRENGNSPTITCNHEAPIVCHGTQDPLILKDKSFPLGRNGGRENVLAIRTAQTSANGHGIADNVGLAVAIGIDEECNARIDHFGPLLRGGQGGTRQAVMTPTTGTVRRCTPIECERLQGFPDNHTRIPWRNKPAEDCPDGPRYKAIGNSKAVPVIKWIGERINAHTIKTRHP